MTTEEEREQAEYIKELEEAIEACAASEVGQLRIALGFYANPESYFAVAIWPDRPAGDFADDVGCVIGPHGTHDHRHGRKARRALGSEWWGTEPCEEMLKAMREEDDG